jgi:hypothetical protein
MAYTYASKHAPVANNASNTVLSSADLRNTLTSGDSVYLNWPRQEASGRLVDRWDREINITVARVIEKPGTFYFKIWSNGPDGVNDSGTGDDIVLAFLVGE